MPYICAICFMNIKYYKNLDGIRAIAALLVLVFHFFQSLDFGPQVAPFIDNMAIMGSFGVSLFFVLSGFLITRILIASVHESGYFKTFYIRRALRIFPLYYLFLILWYFIYPHFTGTAIAPIKDQLIYYTYQQSFPLTFNWSLQGPGHFWTLGVEEYFYFFWPLVVYYLNKKNLFRFSLLLILAALVTKWILIGNNYNDAFFPLARFDALAMGAILALLEFKSYFKKENAWKFLTVMFLFMVITVLCNTNFVFKLKDEFQVCKFTFIAVIAFGMIGYLLCISPDALLNKILKTNFFTFSGRISYGLYVYNPLVFGIVSKCFSADQWIMAALAGILAVYVVSVLSYYCFEKQFLKLKKYFSY